MRKPWIVAGVLFVCTAAFSYGVSLSDLGYTVQRQYSADGVSYSDAVDPSGHSVTVGTTHELSSAEGALLQQFITLFYGMTYLKVESLKVVFTSDRPQIIVIPSSFVYNGTDIAKYAPSGLQFYHADNLQYDFRLHVTNFFLRVTGTYTDEKSLAERLVQAINSPASFLRSQDPEYMLQRIDALEKEVADLTASNRRDESQLSALASQYDSLKLNFAQLRSDHDSLAADEKQLTDTNSQLTADVESYKKQNDATIAEFKAGFDALRYGILVLHNRGFFGQIFLPDPAAVARIVEIKKASPEMTRDAVLKQVRSEGFKVSNNEIFLVFGLYFDQFK